MFISSALFHLKCSFEAVQIVKMFIIKLMVLVNAWGKKPKTKRFFKGSFRGQWIIKGSWLIKQSVW